MKIRFIIKVIAFLMIVNRRKYTTTKIDKAFLSDNPAWRDIMEVSSFHIVSFIHGCCINSRKDYQRMQGNWCVVLFVFVFFGQSEGGCTGMISCHSICKEVLEKQFGTWHPPKDASEELKQQRQDVYDECRTKDSTRCCRKKLYWLWKG